MIARKQQVELTPEARGLLAGLLNSDEGQNILDALAATCPTILDKGTAEDMLSSAHAHRGWEACVEQLLYFVAPTPVPETEPKSRYTDLDDDAAWEKESNAQKVEEETT